MFSPEISTIITFAFGLLFSVIGFLIVWILNSIKENIKKLFQTTDEHERRLSKLEGEHSARICTH